MDGDPGLAGWPAYCRVLHRSICRPYCVHPRLVVTHTPL